MMRRFPDTILFSSMDPAGMSIRSPWLAMMMTVPCEEDEGVKYKELWKALKLRKLPLRLVRDATGDEDESAQSFLRLSENVFLGPSE